MTQIRDTHRYRIYFIALLFVTGISLNLPVYSATSDMQGSVSVLHDDNVTRTMDSQKPQSDQSLSISISQPFVLPMSTHTRTILTGALDIAKYLDIDLLSYVSGRLQGEYQYRSSAEFGTPTYSLFAKAALVDYQSQNRDGMEYSVGLSMRKTITDRIRGYAAVFHHERDAYHTVFQNAYDGFLINLDYDVGSTGTLYLGGEYRDGDMAISYPVEWTWYTLSPADATIDDTFSGWSYRVTGSTQILKAGFNMPISQSSSMDVAWNMAESNATYWTDLGKGSTTGSYTTNQYSVAYMLRF